MGNISISSYDMIKFTHTRRANELLMTMVSTKNLLFVRNVLVNVRTLISLYG